MLFKAEQSENTELSNGISADSQLKELEQMMSLLQNYNVPVPRYTSYPTVPNWNNEMDSGTWTGLLATDLAASAEKGISLYIHLPFCESLCTYCGCNKKITKNHGVESRYIHAVIKEWQLYLQQFKGIPLLRELHLGGGTPTFFSAENLEQLLKCILACVKIHPDAEFSFEAHPNNTSYEHLKTLYDQGFRRLSLGVQDNDPFVQKMINRIQSFENVVRVTNEARELGYKSVNFDLIYGLPFQSLSSIEKTITDVVSARPDRVAFYSYAHVPWTSRGQRLFDENDLPSSHEKIKLYRRGREIFLQNGYLDIGMDHFALPDDELTIATREGRLQRNFMGYTTQATDIMIGLGMSSISSSPSAYAQNSKSLQEYYESVENGQLAIEKGYRMTDLDRRFGKYIRNISCNGYTEFEDCDSDLINRDCMPHLRKLKTDKLIELNEKSVRVTALGRNFIRNICSAFDLYLNGSLKENTKPLFSKAI